jgi:hypothetical protein
LVGTGGVFGGDLKARRTAPMIAEAPVRETNGQDIANRGDMVLE